MTDALYTIKNPQVKALLDDLYRYNATLPSYTTLMEGEYGAACAFPDLSFEARAAQKNRREEFRARIRALAGMSPAPYDALVLEEAEFFLDNVMMPVSSLILISSFDPSLYDLFFNITTYNMPIAELWDYLAALKVSTVAQREKHLLLAQDYRRFCEQMMTRVEEQAQKGIYLFDAAIDSSAAILKRYGSVPYERHPLCMAGSGASESQLAQERRAVEAGGESLLRLREYLLSDAYRRHAPKATGWAQYPDGERFYRHLSKLHLGYSEEPAAIHRLGLELMAQAEEAQRRLREKLCGRDCGHGDFINSLKGDGRFFASRPEQVGGLITDYLCRASGAMNTQFRERIKAGYLVERLDPAQEKVMTFGYFLPAFGPEAKGIYYYNGGDLEHRCQITMPALIAHEMLPGHHFQQSWVSESGSLHPLLKLITSGCYLEGWAEYGAVLMREQGVLDDWDEYGRLEMERFSSARMVADTGLNAMGWPLAKAEQFLVENTFATPVMAKSEALRYATSIPAQCLPYRYGCVKMLELRELYSKARGPAADLRDFHSMVLQPGNVPMPLLNGFIKAQLGL